MLSDFFRCVAKVWQDGETKEPADPKPLPLQALLGALTLLGKGYEFNVIVGPPLETFAGGGHEMILKVGEHDV